MTHTRKQHGRSAASVIVPGLALVAALTLAGLGASGVRAQSPRVLLVGPSGTAGAQFTSIQAAVDQAQPGDWVLVAPGVYHEKGTGQSTTKPAPADVLITTPGIHLRGMNRDTVIVDGTNLSPAQHAGTLPAGSPACSADMAAQDFGPKDSSGTVHTPQGIEVYKVSGVSIENLSACNALVNEIWWNAGDGSGVLSPMAINGDYITATSTFYKDANTASAQYGIFTSNEAGPGLIDHSYANNMTDSSYYIGACRTCNMVLNHPHAENSALGLSSTNSGGSLTVENGEWDLNRTGLVSNSQNNDDAPSPEYGQCVAPATPPAGAGPNSCYVITGNFIHDNNNPNTPGTGLTAVSAVGTGIELAATQHISVIANRIENNGSWGVVTHDFPDPESGPAKCGGGVDVPAVGPTPEICTYYSRGNFVAGNSFTHNGFFGNPGNADIANEATGAAPVPPTDSVGKSPDPNCFSANTDASGTVSGDPPTLQSAQCSPANSDSANAVQLVCATGALSLFTSALGPCPASPVTTYPQHDANCAAPAVLTPAGDKVNGVCFLPLSYTLSAQVSPPMPDPCAGVPANAFCPASTSTSAGAAANPAITATPNTGGDRSGVAWLSAAVVLLLATPAVLIRRARRRR